MSAETDFKALRTKLRDKCIYLADDDILQRLEWFETQGFDRIVLKDDVDQYMEDGAPLDRPPQAARLAGIFRLTHRHDFFMRACGRWKPNAAPFHHPFANIRPSAFTEDPGITELEGDYSKSWNNVAELSKEWYRSHDEDEAKVTQSKGVINWQTKSVPNPAHGFKIGHKVFEKRTPESLEDFVDHGPEFNIENWPLEFEEEAKPELEKIKDTHIAHPIPAYYPDPESNLIPPDKYWDDLRGAVVRLEFHLNHWDIDGRHIFTADIVRMKVLVRPNLPAPSPRKRKAAPSTSAVDALAENGRSAKRQAVSSSIDVNVPWPNLKADPSTPPRSTKETSVKTEMKERPIKSEDKSTASLWRFEAQCPPAC